MKMFRDTIHELTGGRPFVLVLMSYKASQDQVFQIIKDVVERHQRLCIRADEVPGAGYDLLAKVHQLIERAELIIAETTDPEPGKPSPNVYYEIGYAVALGKKPILLRENGGSDLPVDLKGLEVIRYENRVGGQKELEQRLSDDVRSRLASDIPVLRDMLLGTDPSASFIVTQPKRPKESIPGKRIATFGDRLGILGLLRAFGSILDDSGKVDLVSPRHSAKELLGHDVNLYFIGSHKTVEAVSDVLKRLQTGRLPQWSIIGDPEWKPSHRKETEEDRPLNLVKNDGRGSTTRSKAMRERMRGGKAEMWTQDYGLIVRAPHPTYGEKRVVLIMAGLHSLGTGAACLAATRPGKIKEIREKLIESIHSADTGNEGILANKKRAFWALVKGTIGEPDYLLKEDDVSIEAVGVYE